MYKGLFLLVFLATGSLCPAQTSPPSLPSWDDQSQAAWWAQNPNLDQWTQASADLTAQLEGAYKQMGPSCYGNPDFQGWLEHLEWIELGVDNPTVLADAENLKAFIAVGKDPAISHLFIEKLDPRDIKKQALLNILQLARANLSDLHEYAALGVAFSLVFDAPFPEDWPHHQVKPEAVPIGDLDVAQRFGYYVQANRSQKLDQDLSRLTFENLKFLVDSKVKLSEFDYAQQNHILISHFEDAFFSITYSKTRINSANAAYDWELPTYTLLDIEQNGGICVDQAYYAATLGKGRGIPTLYFHGQGVDGGHAWFGYLARSGHWELDCGRYESQNYPKGYALDPQTWEVIDDTMLTNFFKNGDKNPNFQSAQNAIAWARLHGRDPVCQKILDEARALMPELAQTWRIEANVLENSHAGDDVKKDFYQNWITQFTSFLDMKVEGQRHLLAVLKSENDPGVHELEQNIVLQNRTSGFADGIEGAASILAEKVNAGEWDDARLEFEKTIRDFGDQGGGTLYYDIIAPYIKACLKAGQTSQAERAVHFLRDRVQFTRGSILSEEFNRLKGDVTDQTNAAAK